MHGPCFVHFPWLPGATSVALQGLDAWTAQSMATKVDEQAVSMVKQGPFYQGVVVKRKMKPETSKLATTLVLSHELYKYCTIIRGITIGLRLVTICLKYSKVMLFTFIYVQAERRECYSQYSKMAKWNLKLLPSHFDAWSSFCQSQFVVCLW